MNYQQSTGKSIEQAFTEYHEENPEVFVEFRRFLRDILLAECTKRNFHLLDSIKEEGKFKTSAKMIINRIRWEVATVGLKGTNSEDNASNMKFDAFKINDAFTSHYARLFVSQNPEWGFLFNQRKLRA